MKQKTQLQFSFFAAIISFTSCAHLPKGDKAIVTEPQQAVASATATQFVIDTAATFVRFIGHGVGQNHPGRFHLSSGTVSVTNGVISGGQFNIAITSLEIEQPQKIYQTKLKKHLLSADFFDTNVWRTATFEITNIKPVVQKSASILPGANTIVSGNLTLKGVVKNVTFPAKIILTTTTLITNATFTIDRTQWGMYYGSDKSLGNKAISPQVTVQLNITAAR